MRLIRVNTQHSARAWLRRNHIPPSPACRRLFKTSDVMAVLDGRVSSKIRSIEQRWAARELTKTINTQPQLGGIGSEV